jgi:aryl-alcohol dehydrogenase-like predicted oxidoreductase
VSRIGLGTVQFGLPYGIANQSGQVSRTEAGLMIAYAASCGISVIDTAIAYGESEACLGTIGVRGFKVVTKLPSVPDDIDVADVPNWVCGQVTASLRRLGVATLYGLLLHKPSQLLGRFGTPIAGALVELKAKGLIDKLGISIYAPEELEVLDRIFQIELVQAPFNLLDRRLLTSGWLGRLKRSGIEVHTRSAFLQGLLLMPKSSIPSEFSHWSDLWQTWHRWLALHDISALRACLTFVLSYPEIDHVVVGADNVDHLRKIIASVSIDNALELPDLTCEDLNLIDPSRWNR